jgi:hypothetical protein
MPAFFLSGFYTATLPRLWRILTSGRYWQHKQSTTMFLPAIVIDVSDVAGLESAGVAAGKRHLSCRSSVEKDPDCSNHQLVDTVENKDWPCTACWWSQVSSRPITRWAIPGSVQALTPTTTGA